MLIDDWYSHMGPSCGLNFQLPDSGPYVLYNLPMVGGVLTGLGRAI